MAGNIEECLKKFIIHVDRLAKEDDPGGDGFTREFRDLRELQNTHKAENKFPAEEGRRECNIKKNRYKDILPYDSHRVTLGQINGVEGSDYINASFIEDINGQRSYIASQGPLPHTVNDFWRMLWEYEVEIVFMVCREEEQGRAKCQRYWAEEGETKAFGDIEVTLESEETLFPDFVERKLHAEYNGKSHMVKQFHYTGWPDHGIPSHSQEIYKMVGKMREERRLLTVPIVIHCSAGCGRTGTICAVDYAWTLLDQGKIAHGFSMHEIIKNLRQQRQSMVQTPDQYEFAHLVVQSLCEDWLNKFQEHDYANTFFLSQEEQEEVYYNTIGLNNSASTANEMHQQTAKPPSPSGRKKAAAVKKPQPAPRQEVNNNNNDNKVKNKKDQFMVSVNARSDLSYENFVVPTVSRTVSNDASKTSPKNKRQQGHHAKVSGATKSPPNHHPPPPNQSHTTVHRNAVITKSQEIQAGSQPVPGSVQKAADKKKRASSSTSSGEDASLYSDVRRMPGDRQSGHTDQVHEGQQKRESGQNPSSQSMDSAPVLPERNYGPEDIDPQSASSTTSQAHEELSRSRVYAEIDVGRVDTQVSSQVSAGSSATLPPASKMLGALNKFIAVGRGKPQPTTSQTSSRPDITHFRGKNIGYPNRVDRPKGVRNAENRQMTRL